MGPNADNDVWVGCDLLPSQGTVNADAAAVGALGVGLALLARWLLGVECDRK